MAPPRLNPDEVIEEFEQRGVTIEPHQDSSTGYALKVGSSGGVIPDWLFTNLERNSSAVAERVQTKSAGQGAGDAHDSDLVDDRDAEATPGDISVPARKAARPSQKRK